MVYKKLIGGFCAFFAFMFLIVALPLLCGGYFPNKWSNDRAQTVNCEQTDLIIKDFCSDKSGVTSECFKIYVYNRVFESECGRTAWLGTFNSYITAKEYFNKYYIKFNYTCFLDPEDPCAPFRDYKETHTLFILSMVFLGISGAFFVTSLTLIILSMLKK